MGYLTKNESGTSKLLKAVNDQAKDIPNMELLNQLSSVLDKHREVSIQEAVYRMLSLPMTKSSIKVKHLTTMHPHFRDGLLKGNIEDLDEDEPIFHMSPHQYYENRFLKCIVGVRYEDDEMEEGYWENLTLAEFWSFYDIVYGENKPDNQGNLKYIPLDNKKGFIKRRSENCVLRYYLNYNNDEDLARGLLVLFHPFKNEMKEIHDQNVIEIYENNRRDIEEKRSLFEKHKVMTDMIYSMQKEKEKSDVENDQDDFVETETTSPEDIESFEKWARDQAKVALTKHQQLTKLVKLNNLRDIIITLNGEQRKLFDDFCERIICEDDTPFHLYIGGEAGTGKSYLLRLMIEIVKHLRLKSGDELNKPSAIVMAPTANAAYIINGKTIESALGMLPRQRNSFVKVKRDRLSNLTFLFEDVVVAFCDEISMVGTSKFTKMHFQLQDILGNNSFMGGLNFIAVGDFRQLPPVLDGYVYENNHLDGRPALAPSHWDENFQIFYLTQKMRSQKDPEFSSICDRIGNGTYNKADLKYLQRRVENTKTENNNENFKDGKLSIIVTTNKKRQDINESKLETLLENERSYEILAQDRSTNMENPPEVSEKMSITQTGGLEYRLIIKKNAPIVITSNHPLSKYKEDGIVNGARGFIDSVQMSKKSRHEVEVIWVVFKDKNIGRRLRYEYGHLKKIHKPIHEDAVPILKQKKSFSINRGEVRFQRKQFPLTLAYAITAYKCQGDTLEEVIIDFSHEPGDKAHIQWGSFYVALTRVKEGGNVYLKAFDESYITFNVKVERKISAMREFKAYRFKKIYLSDPIFKEANSETKLGYFNISGFLESNHAEYLDNDINLLNLQLLIISETWLTSDIPNKKVIESLKNWKIVKRLDATDNKKHMGLLLIMPNDFKGYKDLVYSLDYVEGHTQGKKDKKLLYQGIVINLKKTYKKIIGLYIRETPNEREVVEMSQRFDDHDCIIGDLNLNPAIAEQKKKLLHICGQQKCFALEEVTTINNHQLDHILLDKTLLNQCFATSYNNFASHHKAITLRFGQRNSEFRKEFLEKINFDADHHLKSKVNRKNEQVPRDPCEIRSKKKHYEEKLKVKDEQTTQNLREISGQQMFNQPMSKKYITLAFMNPPGRNLCFSNVAASCLLNIPSLKTFIQHISTSEQDHLVAELNNLASLRHTTKASTNRLRTIVKLKCFKAGQRTRNFNNDEQHDSAEFIQSLIEHLWNEPAVPAILKEKIFGGLHQDVLKCPCGNIVELPIQEMPELLPIQLRGQTIQSCVEESFSPQNVEWNCPKCKKSQAKKETKIIKEPETLILQLMRYKFNDSKQQSSKRHNEVICSPSLMLASGSTYTLSSVINHIGEDTQSGHYNIVIFDTDQQMFVLLDDSVIVHGIEFNQEMNESSYIFTFIKDV